MIGTIVKKPRITALTELLPILAMEVNAPIHLEKEVISLNSKKHMSMKVPLCSSWCVSPILLTDDIKKCTCKQCMSIVANIVYKNKTALKFKGENEKNEKRINTDGLCT